MGLLTLLRSSATGVTFSDDFNRGTGALGANYASVGSGPPTIVSNQVAGGTAVAPGVRYTTPTLTDNHYSEITLVGQHPQVGPAVAMPAFADGASAAAAGTWYRMGLTGTTGAGGVAILQKDAGLTSFTTLVSDGTALAGTETIRLSYLGGVLIGYVNGVQRLTFTPSSPITGQRYVGFANQSSNNSGVAILDNWAGGDLATVVATAFAGWGVPI